VQFYTSKLQEVLLYVRPFLLHSLSWAKLGKIYEAGRKLSGSTFSINSLTGNYVSRVLRCG
jgi:hypothetical protein